MKNLHLTRVQNRNFLLSWHCLHTADVLSHAPCIRIVVFPSWTPPRQGLVIFRSVLWPLTQDLVGMN